MATRRVPSVKHKARLAVTGLLFLLGALAALTLVSPGPARPATAPPDVFSAGRARAHVDWLASHARPTGAAGHTLARERLSAELSALDAEVDAGPATAVSTFYDPDVVIAPPAPGERWSFRHVGLGQDGLAFTLVVPASSGPLRLRVVDQSLELPPDVEPRPEGMVACRSWIADSTLVSAEGTF